MKRKKLNSCCLLKQIEIDKLKEENKSLKTKINYLEKKTKDGYFGTSTPSSKKPFKTNADKKKKNGGAKKGHIGYGRKKINKDTAKNIDIPVSDICPECKQKMQINNIIQRGIIDGKMPSTENIIYNCEKRYCKKCKKTYIAQAPVLPRSLYGNGLLSMIISMFYLEGIPLNRILEMLGNKINKGSIINALHKVSDIFSPMVETIRKDYCNNLIRHADETGWRTDGDSGYAWLFCSNTESIYIFANTRSGQIPLSILGAEELKGYLIVDRYGGYNCIKCKKQYCYAHLLRDIKKIKDDYGGKNPEVEAFTNQSIDLVSRAMGLNNKYKLDLDYYEEAKKIELELKDVMASGSLNSKIKKIQKIFLKNEYKLYHWAYNRNVPADNNFAEREIRPIVVARKVSFGSQSSRGAKTRSIFTTILHTAEKRLGSDQAVTQWLKNTLDIYSENQNINITELLPKTK